MPVLSCVILPQDQVDPVVGTCLKAWHGFSPRLPRRLVETNGRTNEPLKAPLICPMALLEIQDGGEADKG